MSARPGNRLLLGFIGFLVLCGAILLLVGETGAAGQGDSSREHAWSAMKSAEAADRALESRDYGEARKHIRKTQDRLQELIKDLE